MDNPAFSTRSYAVSEQAIRAILQAQLPACNLVTFAGNAFPERLPSLPRFYWLISRQYTQPAVLLPMPFQSFFQAFLGLYFCVPRSILPLPVSEL
jgi:hypothetical protein